MSRHRLSFFPKPSCLISARARTARRTHFGMGSFLSAGLTQGDALTHGRGLLSWPARAQRKADALERGFICGGACAARRTRLDISSAARRAACQTRLGVGSYHALACALCVSDARGREDLILCGRVCACVCVCSSGVMEWCDQTTDGGPGVIKFLKLQATQTATAREPCGWTGRGLGLHDVKVNLPGGDGVQGLRQRLQQAPSKNPHIPMARSSSAPSSKLSPGRLLQAPKPSQSGLQQKQPPSIAEICGMPLRLCAGSALTVSSLIRISELGIQALGLEKTTRRRLFARPALKPHDVRRGACAESRSATVDLQLHGVAVED